MKSYVVFNLLESMANEERRNFSPFYLCERLGLDNSEILDITRFLLGLPDIVKPRYEVECPEGDSDFYVDNLKSIENSARTCHLCGQKYIPDPNRIWVVFNFVESYKADVKKKKTSLQIVPYQMVRKNIPVLI